MTRETKIGLLVGLAFIIVIGILLSDHLTQSTEPQPAVLAVAGNTVRAAITVPGATGSGVTTPPITQASAPSNVQPTNPVLTRDEVQRPEPPVQIVQVGAPTLTNASGPVTPAGGNTHGNHSALSTSGPQPAQTPEPDQPP